MYKYITILVFLFCTSLYSQQHIKETPLETLTVSDSVKENIEKLNSFKLRFHTFRRRYFSDDLKFNEPILPYSTWMLSRTSFSSKDNYAPLLQQSDMIRSYKMLYGVDDDVKYLNMILGMAQTATVGVLAYKHIKKYGFLSK